MAYKIPIEIIELESENYHILITSVFGDGTKGLWVIDTGASKSVFDKNQDKYIEKIEGSTEDLHSAGIGEEPMKGEIALLKPFSLSKLKVESMKVALLDLTHVNKLYASTAGVEICGLIGSDFLVRHNAIINYRKKSMVLRK